MRSLWIEFVRRLKTVWAALLIAGAALVAALLYLFTRRSRETTPSSDLSNIIDHVDERVQAANAHAAIEIHVAETKSADVRAEQIAIAKDPDGPSRRQKMIALANRIGAEKP